MSTGVVKFFNSTKGFGFIKDSDNGTETFVHISGLVDDVREGDEVTYEVIDGKRGLTAVQVKLK